MRKLLVLSAILVAAAAAITLNDMRPTAHAQTSGPAMMTIEIAGQASGIVTVELLPDVAPLHVAQISTLARQGAYDGVVFHRVIEGFMAQTGDVQFGINGTDTDYAGRGGSDLPDIPAEFSDLPFERGTVGMARSQNPNSANSQFFIMFAPGRFLDGNYTVIGRVVDGMDVVDAIKLGEGPNGAVLGAPDYMARVAIVE